MSQTIKVGDLRGIITESSNEFKATIAKGVETDNKKNNEKSYKESTKRAKDYDGGLNDPKKVKLERSDDNNRTTLGYTPSNEPSKEYKERVKAQAKGYTSVAAEKRGSKDDDGEYDDEARIYNSIKDNEKNKIEKRAEVAKSGLVGDKLDKGERNDMFENAAPKTKRLIFKKTTFMNENQMLSRIPEEYKVDGQKIYMKDKSDNEYIVEFTKSQRTGQIDTYVVGFNNNRIISERVDRIHELFNYDTNVARGNKTQDLRVAGDSDFNNLLNAARNLQK
jgi:hypothetical protein